MTSWQHLGNKILPIAVLCFDVIHKAQIYIVIILAALLSGLQDPSNSFCVLQTEITPSLF